MARRGPGTGGGVAPTDVNRATATDFEVVLPATGDQQASSPIPTLSVDPIDELELAEPNAVVEMSTLAPGDRVDHYIIRDKLGEGGMGHVFAGYDERLQRNVAIKVLRPLTTDSAGAAKARSRLLREARAVAKLTHPNVVTVHGVGMAGEQVFVAMELVRNGTLRAWLQQQPRTRKEILDVFTQAGRGLAAAHEAGLVHRDFKLDNVLLGRHDRAVVTDFGLVGVAGESLGGAPIYEEGATDIDADGDRLSLTQIALTVTKTGHVIGTPGYMAPEQFRGDALDAGADQFAFCVALYEALYGERPFGGATYTELASSVLDGLVKPAPRGSDVPLRLRSVLLRGLSPERSDRYATMTELLEAIREATSARRRVWGYSVAGIAAAGALGLGLAVYSGVDKKSAASEDVRPPAKAGVAEVLSPTQESSVAPSAKPAPPPIRQPPTRVTLQIESTPTGALVYREVDGVEVGATPFEATVVRSEGAAKYLLKSPGYEIAKVEIPTSKDGSRTVTLSKQAPAPKPAEALAAEAKVRAAKSARAATTNHRRRATRNKPRAKPKRPYRPKKPKPTKRLSPNEFVPI